MPMPSHLNKRTFPAETVRRALSRGPLYTKSQKRQFCDRKGKEFCPSSGQEEVFSAAEADVISRREGRRSVVR